MYDYCDVKREICMVLTFGVVFPVQTVLLFFYYSQFVIPSHITDIIFF
jgi:hypothetical protein